MKYAVTFTKTSTTPASIILTNRLAFPVYFSMSVSPTIEQFGAPAK